VQFKQSIIDESANFIAAAPVGFFEARYVRRSKDYFIAYISSQSGCAQGCRMCYLTRMGETKLVNATQEEMVFQAKRVIAHYLSKEQAKTIHFNFMARGEPLKNPDVNSSLLGELYNLAVSNGLYPKFKISTIMPRGLESEDLVSRFAPFSPDIYYSFYSVDPEFRKKWLPSAMYYDRALEILREYQRKTNKIVKIHGAFIENENDSIKSIEEMVNALLRHGLHVDWNIVRYNPFSGGFGKEPNEQGIQRITRRLQNLLPFSKVTVVPRVGIDVNASCGMFTNAKELEMGNGEYENSPRNLVTA